MYVTRPKNKVITATRYFHGQHSPAGLQVPIRRGGLEEFLGTLGGAQRVGSRGHPGVQEQVKL